MSYKLTIVIPVYNEADNLLRVEKECGLFLKSALVKSKVYL